MASLKCRVGLRTTPQRFRLKPIVARLGRLCLIKEPASGLYSVMHAPTGLALHSRLTDLPLRVAKHAMTLAHQLDEWNWTDPNEILDRPSSETRDLWVAFVTIAEMAEAR